MGFLYSLFADLFPETAWRMKCPSTVRGIAEHFLEIHCPSVTQFLTASIGNAPGSLVPEFAWRRRISAIYGISKHYSHPREIRQQRGWNRTLWKNHPDMSPDELVDLVFTTMMEIVLIRQDSTG